MTGLVNDRISEGLPVLRVGIVDWGWMGPVHARAYTRLLQHYSESPCGRSSLLLLTMPVTKD